MAIKQTAGTVLAVVMLSQAAVSFAAEAKTQAADPNAPITVTADELQMNQTTGAVKADGKVNMQQQDRQMLTEHLEGNVQTGDMHLKDDSTFIDARAHLVGKEVVYNYKTKQGTMQSFSGKVEKEYLKGQQVVLEPQMYVVQKGYTTRCSLDDPDYRIEADKIEVYPDDNKYIAYNAKFKIKNTTIYSLARYEGVLNQEGGDQTPFPKVGYYNDDGFYIRQHLSNTIRPNVKIFANLGYYTKAGFRPDYGITYAPKDYSFSVITGKYRDGDGNWIKKVPEYDFHLNAKPLGNLPVKYTFDAVYGKWIEGDKASWHQDYSLYFTHDPIHFNKSTTLSLGTGVEKIFESYDQSQRTNYRFDANVDRVWSDQFKTFTAYHYRKSVDTLFNYNNDDMAKELDWGFTYKVDKKNSLSVSQSYDLEKNQTHDIDYTITHDMHCWQASITYRAKRDQLKFDVAMTKW